MKKLATRIAKETGKILLENFGRKPKVLESMRHDLRIKMDRIAEQNIIRMIEDSGMECDILSEECGELKKGCSEYRWIIDPLDGTVNYAYGIPHFCVSIALEKDGEIILGVVNDPYKKELFFAEKGKGAIMNNRRIRVSRRSKLKDAIIVTYTGHKDKNIRRYLRNYERLVFSVKKIRITGTAALDLCYVACGRFDGCITLNARPWDNAAGAFIIQEAGGRVGTLDGNAWNPFVDDIIAT